MANEKKEWIYEVMASGQNNKIVEIEAKSSIDAARKFLNRQDVKRLTSNDKCIWKYDCVVWKCDKNDTQRIPYDTGYYR